MIKVTRNPQETQQKILESALEEFAEHGYHGARIDRIVKNAGVNKRMVYHYFKDKDGLFTALMKTELDNIQEVTKTEPTEDFFELANHWLKNIDQTKNYFRLSLSSDCVESEGVSLLEQEQQRGFDFSKQIYADLIKKEGLSDEVDPAYFLLAMISLTSLPMVLPTMSKLVTGKNYDSEEFRHEYERVIRVLFPIKPN
ncbi:TetR/AcrR family transcriptional regulator [Vibrio gigantis]|uniref:TetR/AcrR family transcriptional regulator n=1 Tax=Vibrio gigantis TaxID=296199 RepID=UPI0035A6A162